MILGRQNLITSEVQLLLEEFLRIMKKIEKFPKQSRMLNIVKEVKRLNGFVDLSEFYAHACTEIVTFSWTTPKIKNTTINNDHQESSTRLKSDLTHATDLTLWLARKPGQHVVLCDANFKAAGFALMIEDYVIDQNSKVKTYAPKSFVSRLLMSTELKFSAFYKIFWHCILP